MKVSDLIKELMTFEAAHGDLDVKIITDHGQLHFNADEVSLSATEEPNAHMSDPVEIGTGVKVCQIQ